VVYQLPVIHAWAGASRRTRHDQAAVRDSVCLAGFCEFRNGATDTTPRCLDRSAWPSTLRRRARDPIEPVSRLGALRLNGPSLRAQAAATRPTTMCFTAPRQKAAGRLAGAARHQQRPATARERRQPQPPSDDADYGGTRRGSPRARPMSGPADPSRRRHPPRRRQPMRRSSGAPATSGGDGALLAREPARPQPGARRLCAHACVTVV
jgi:hypothetical protein